MQKLGILASVLLLAAAIIGPVGLSHAQTVDTAAVAKEKDEKARDAFDQTRADRLDAQKQQAANNASQLINEFNATGEEEKVRNIIDIYLSSIVPLAKKIRDTTYVYNNVEYDENTSEYRLIQKKYNIKSMEVEIEHPQVISFTK